MKGGNYMNKKSFGFAILTVLMITIVSAVLIYGTGVSSSFATNSSNVLDGDFDFAVLQQDTTSALTCPLGDFTDVGNVCLHVDGGISRNMLGWIAIDFRTNSTNNSKVGVINVSKITVSASELNINCTSCSGNTAYHLFSTNFYNASNTIWAHRKTCLLLNDAAEDKCAEHTTAEYIESIVIGAENLPIEQPDPAIHYVRLTKD